jgi:hypothetical protein
MSNIFTLKSSNLKNLRKFYKKAPKQFSWAVAGVLNDQAFGTRKTAMRRIGRNMIVRNPNLVRSHVLVEKAKGGQSIALIQSETGSIDKKRFSGWVEQETGERTKRTRTQTVLARGGSKQNIVRPGFRMKSGNPFPTSDDFGTGSKENRTIAMLATLSHNKFKKPFILSSRKFRKGLYKFARNKIKKLQDFQPSKIQPKRKPWLIPGRADYFAKTNLNTVWAQQLNRILQKRL